MLPVLLLNGVLHLDVVENAVTSADFCCFVEGLCHGRCILLSLIFYFERHVTVRYFT